MSWYHQLRQLLEELEDKLNELAVESHEVKGRLAVQTAQTLVSRSLKVLSDHQVDRYRSR